MKWEQAYPTTSSPFARIWLRDPGLWVVTAMVVDISLLHYLTDAQLVPYHAIYRSLYCIPLAVAAVRWGLRGGMAHELRNPLGITRAAAQMLQQELADDGVEQLLAYARPRPLQRALVDVASLVEETSSLARVYAKQQGVTLTTQVSDDLPALMGDGVPLHQAVVNVLLNGIQATPPGGTVNLTAQTEQASVLLTVCDTGQGIAPGILPHIFDPFFTTRDDGTGLGLSIVQQIIHDHGGAVDVQSESEQGTQVVLRLPIAAGITKRRYDEVIAQ